MNIIIIFRVTYVFSIINFKFLLGTTIFVVLEVYDIKYKNSLNSVYFIYKQHSNM